MGHARRGLLDWLKCTLPAIVAITVLAACSKTPSPEVRADPSGASNRTLRLTGSRSGPTSPGPRRQLADFRLQTACAAEARAWVNEHERNEGYTPASSGLGLLEMDQTHYSLAEHGCYAIVDERITSNLPSFSEYSDERRLFEVDGGWHAVAAITGATRNPRDGMYGIRRILTHGMKLCTVGARKCSSYAEWQALTRPYLKE